MRYLSACDHLKKISLQENEIGNEIVLMKAQKSLAHLNLRGNRIRDLGAMGIAQMQGITDLDVSENLIGMQGMLALTGMKHLKNFEIQGNQEEDDFSETESLEDSPWIFSPSNRFEEPILERQQMPFFANFESEDPESDQEQAFMDSSAGVVQIEGRRQMQELLRSDLSGSSITMLSIQRTNIRDEDFLNLFQQSAYQNVRVLDLSDSFLNVSILSNLPNTVEELVLDHLRDHRDESIGIEDLVSFLSPLSHLKKLSLQWTEVNDDSVAWITSMQQITELRLGGNYLGDLGAEKISHMHRLTLLDLEGNRVGDLGASKIAELPALKVLNLRLNQVDLFGVKRIAQNSNIVSLNLDYNRIQDDAVESIAEMKSLKSLSLKGHKLTPAGKEKLRRLPGLKI
jgi:Leucine-rich repeat (LRR) protein